MKILYIVHQFYPMHYTGTEKFLLNLAMMMQKFGHKVKVVTYSFYEDSFYDKSENGFLQKEFLFKGIEVLAIKQSAPPQDLNWGMSNHPLRQFAERSIKREQPDVLHLTHGMRMGEFAMAAMYTGIPFVVTMTDFFLMCPRCILINSQQQLCFGPKKGDACRTDCPEFVPEYIKTRLSIGQEILINASSVVAPSKFLGSLFEKEFPGLEMKVIPYGIDFSALKRSRKDYLAQRKLTFLYAGQLNYHKGVHVLLEAFMHIKHENVALKLYGSGPDDVTSTFKNMVRGDKRVEFCGVYSEDNIGEVFNSADVVVIPSNWHENNTIVMREALASHVPCVVSNAGGMIEKIADGVNGFVFRMGDVFHLKETLEKIVEKPDLLHSMRKNLHSYALTTVEQEAYAYELEYQRVLNIL